MFQRSTSLNGDLPKLLVERNHDSSLGFCQFQQGKVFGARKIRPRPQNIVVIGAQRLYNLPRKILVGEETRLRWNRKRFVFVGEVTGIREAREDVLPRQARIVGNYLALGLPRRQQFKDQLDGNTGPADHWLAGQDLKIYNDALRKRHTFSVLLGKPVRQPPASPLPHPAPPRRNRRLQFHRRPRHRMREPQILRV